LWCDPETDRDAVAKESGRRFEMHRQPLPDVRLSDLPQDIVVEAFHLAAHHFQALGYPDWWVIAIASDAVGRQDWGLVRLCLELFERRRVFCSLEACILASLWTALPAPAEEPSDEDVHELIEEGVQQCGDKR
jgi:hypothetical protein